MTPPRTIWTYWVSRDSIRGEPVQTCSIWWSKPVRVVGKRNVTWIGKTDNDTRFGDYTLEETFRFCRTTPDDDLQLVKVEQYAHSDEQKPQTKKRRRK